MYFLPDLKIYTHRFNTVSHMLWDVSDLQEFIQTNTLSRKAPLKIEISLPIHFLRQNSLFVLGSPVSISFVFREIQGRDLKTRCRSRF
jgi:hypothetical protein